MISTLELADVPLYKMLLTLLVSQITHPKSDFIGWRYQLRIPQQNHGGYTNYWQFGKILQSMFKLKAFIQWKKRRLQVKKKWSVGCRLFGE